MKPLRTGNPVALTASLLLFALLCAIIAYWALQLTARKPSIAPPEILADPRAGIDLAAAGGLFGRPPSQAGAPPPEVANIQVVGIAADPQRGAAILAIDGKPGKPYLLGDTLVPNTRLAAVRADAVVIDRGGSRIELPVPDRPSVALLSSGPNGAPGARGPRPMTSNLAPLPPRPLPPSGAAALPTGASASTPPPPPGTPGPAGMPGAPGSIGALPAGTPGQPMTPGAMPGGAIAPGAPAMTAPGAVAVQPAQ